MKTISQTEPVVSVIIPNYNHARFLKQRINSVLNQTYQDFEVIILDDFSTDNSKEIIEFYRNNQKIKHIIYNDENSGSTFKQWQKGIEISKGEYIWIAESDDFADEIFLETLIKSFIFQPDIILSYCQSMIVDENSKKFGLSDWADAIDSFKWKQNYVEKAQVELANFLNYRNTIVNASAVVFKKPANNNILEESTKLKITGDWLFWRKLLDQKGKLAFFSTPLNFFRQHADTTRSVTSKEKELIRMKEHNQLIVPSLLSIYDNRYDWMIWEWFNNRMALKNTKYYHIPNLPVTLIIRYFIIRSLNIRRKIFPFAFKHR